MTKQELVEMVDKLNGLQSRLMQGKRTRLGKIISKPMSLL